MVEKAGSLKVVVPALTPQDGHIMNKNRTLLRRNRFFYDYFLKNKILKVRGTLDDESLLDRILFLARFAWRNHGGYYADGRIEDILLQYGRALERLVDRETAQKGLDALLPPGDTPSTLHVATELGDIGGHTRILHQFFKRWEDTDQALVLTGQAVEDLPRWFVDDLPGLKIISLQSAGSLLERSYRLRGIACASKRVILYHHPFDVVPVIALSTDGCPPVCLFDHAHSWFWLGPSVADLVLAPSAFHRDFARKTRPVREVHHFSFTQIDDPDTAFGSEEKVEAKRSLGMSPDRVCIITVGTPEKFLPNSEYNFWRTANRILDRFENVELFVIGIHEDFRPERGCHIESERAHFTGPLSDLTTYYKAADICLDALPQPSLGATFYSVLIGLACPLHKYGAAGILSAGAVIGSSLYERCVGTPRNEEEYLEKLEFLIRTPDIRLKIAEEIKTRHFPIRSREIIAENIAKMLRRVDRLSHKPGRIPAASYWNDANSVEIASMSSLQDLSSTIHHFQDYLTMDDKIAIISGLLIRNVDSPEVVRTAWALAGSKVRSIVSGLSAAKRSICVG